MSPETTDFGYQQVPVSEKTQRVTQVFDSVAKKYDLMNDLMSLGIHRLWKRISIEFSGVRLGQRVLDVAGGTGDLARHYARLVGTQGLVVLADINSSMLQVGRDRLINQGYIETIRYVKANAEALPFADNSFDCINIAFGLRNVTNKVAALTSMLRVLKPGGRLVILEFSKPQHRSFSKLYDLYSFKLLPRLGQWIAKDADSYRYLAESIRMHPDQTTLLQLLQEVGFTQCEYHNLTDGVVAIHRGFKA